MDYLRSCYSTTWRWNADDPHTSTVRWYFAPPGAHLFPVPHRFGSGNYSRQVPAESPFGEQVFQPRAYDGGSTPGGVHGTNFCGNLLDYQQGTEVLASPIGSRSDGQPVCCDGPVGVTVPCCPGVSLPATMYVRFSGGTGAAAAALDGVVVPVLFNGSNAWVSAPTTLCGLAGVLTFGCFAPPGFDLSCTQPSFSVLGRNATRCSPFAWSASGITILSVACPGTIDASVGP